MRPAHWLGYILGVAMLAIGVAVLLGFLSFRGSGGESGTMLRTVFGIVLILYGIYRFVITDMQRRRENRLR